MNTRNALRLAHQFEEGSQSEAAAERVQVTLHVDPNDEPIAGQPANVMVEVVGATCGCELRVQQNDQTIAIVPLDQQSSESAIVFPNGGVTDLIVIAGAETFEFEYYVQPEPQPGSSAGGQVLVIGATIAVTAILVAVFAFVGRRRQAKSIGDNSNTEPSESAQHIPVGTRVLTIIGLVLLGVGVFYVLGSHSILEQIPGLANLPHNSHIYIGGGGAVLGLLAIIAGELLRRRVRPS